MVDRFQVIRHYSLKYHHLFIKFESCFTLSNHQKIVSLNLIDNKPVFKVFI